MLISAEGYNEKSIISIIYPSIDNNSLLYLEMFVEKLFFTIAILLFKEFNVLIR